MLSAGSSVTVEEDVGPATALVPTRAREAFRATLEKALGAALNGDARPTIRIVFRYTDYTPFNPWGLAAWTRPAWLNGDTLEVQVSYVDESGRELMAVESRCTSAKVEAAASRAATIIADYTKRKLLN